MFGNNVPYSILDVIFFQFICSRKALWVADGIFVTDYPILLRSFLRIKQFFQYNKLNFFNFCFSCYKLEFTSFIQRDYYVGNALIVGRVITAYLIKYFKICNLLYISLQEKNKQECAIYQTIFGNIFINSYIPGKIVIE